MDSSFKNDQLRQLNQRIGYPNEPLIDEYEKETIFEYLYEINKELHTYHDILESINNELKEVKNWQQNISGKLTNIYNIEDSINGYTNNINSKLDNIYNLNTTINGNTSNISGKLDNIYNLNKKISENTSTTVTQLTVNTDLSLEGYRVADVMCKIYDVLADCFDNELGKGSLRVRNQASGNEW